MIYAGKDPIRSTLEILCSWWDTTNCGGNVSYDYLKLGLFQHARGSDPERMKVLNIFRVQLLNSDLHKHTETVPSLSLARPLPGSTALGPNQFKSWPCPPTSVCSYPPQIPVPTLSLCPWERHTYRIQILFDWKLFFDHHNQVVKLIPTTLLSSW